MTANVIAPRTPMLVHCQDCKHEWPVLYTPIALGAAAQLMKAALCPMCASREIVVPVEGLIIEGRVP